MTIKFETGLPIAQPMGRPLKYPWDTMPVGSSFLAEGKSIASMSVLASKRSREHGGKYVCRTVVGGVRVHRAS